MYQNGRNKFKSFLKEDERLSPLKKGNPNAPWEMIVGMAFGSRVNLSAFGYYAVPSELINFDPVAKKGRRGWY